jgi:hypothetical protein
MKPKSWEGRYSVTKREVKKSIRQEEKDGNFIESKQKEGSYEKICNGNITSPNMLAEHISHTSSLQYSGKGDYVQLCALYAFRNKAVHPRRTMV